DGLVIPRKLPAPNGVVDAAPIYTKAMSEARPALLKVFTDTFQKYGIDALIGPTTPAVAATQGPEASSLPTFLLFIRNTDPGSNAGIPGLTIPAGLGSSTGLPVGISLDGPRNSDQRLLAIGIPIERVLGRPPPPGRQREPRSDDEELARASLGPARLLARARRPALSALAPSLLVRAGPRAPGAAHDRHPDDRLAALAGAERLGGTPLPRRGGAVPLRLR